MVTVELHVAKDVKLPSDLCICFVNLLCYRNASEFFLIVVYVCKIYEKFGSCWCLFSWLGQKVKDTMHTSC